MDKIEGWKGRRFGGKEIGRDIGIGRHGREGILILNSDHCPILHISHHHFTPTQNTVGEITPRSASETRYLDFSPSSHKQ